MAELPPLPPAPVLPAVLPIAGPRVVNASGDPYRGPLPDGRGKRCMICKHLVPRHGHMAHQRTCIAGHLGCTLQLHIGFDIDMMPCDILTCMAPQSVALTLEKLANKVFAYHLDHGDGGLFPDRRGHCFGYGWNWGGNDMYGPEGFYDMFNVDVQGFAADILNLQIVTVGWAPVSARQPQL